MAETADIIAEQAFFADLEKVFRPHIGECATEMSFGAGRYLFHEGDPADWFFLISHGRIALEIAAPGRRAEIFQTLHDGDVLGMYWLMPKMHWPHDARALEETRVIGIDATCLRRACENNHLLGYDLLKRFVPILLRRLENAQHQLLDVYAHPK